MLKAVAMLSVVLMAGYPRSAESLPGDLDRDGDVDFTDFFIFSDNFGKTGAPDLPDTVFVPVTDTVVVTVTDTLLVTVTDTLHLQGPVPASPPSGGEAGLIDGYWHTVVTHEVLTFDLGPDYQTTDHRIMRVLSAGDGKIFQRYYLKPGGHLLQEEVTHYSTIPITDSIHSFRGDRAADEDASTRFFYDSDMQVISTEHANARDFWTGQQDRGVFIGYLYSRENIFLNSPQTGSSEEYLGLSQLNDIEAYIYADRDRDDVENLVVEGDEDWRWSKDGIDWDAELAK